MEAVEALIAAGEVDLVVVEDLSRLYRNPRFRWAFAQDAVDRGVRVICVADGLDTADENRETMMHAAALRHGLHVPDTRRRVRRTASYAFSRGGMVQKARYGYRKLTAAEAASGRSGPAGLRIARDDAATPRIREMRRRVMEGHGYRAVAEWLREEGVAAGSYAGKGWTARVVEDLLRDPILSGVRTFRDTLYTQVFRTGKTSRRGNPQPETAYHPELAHMTREEHAGLLAAMDAWAAGHGVPSGEGSPLRGRPRSRSAWPGQHARCGACGGLMYRNGRHLRCVNSLPGGERTCWNRVQARFDLIRSAVLPWVLSELEGHTGFREALVESAWGELQRRRSRRDGTGAECEARVAELSAQAARLAKAVARMPDSEALLAELRGVESALAEAKCERTALRERAGAAGMYASREDVAARLPEAVVELAADSWEFADLMRRLLPEFVVVPVQALDTGQVRPRARLTLDLSGWARPGEPVPPPSSAEFDLFEPPGRIRLAAACAAAEAADPKATLQGIASGLGTDRMTVKRALAYARLMAAAGTADPYRPLSSAPASASRWRTRPDRRAAS
jgi:DNA invertase Pin-like site-specific DNA recombinase